MLSDANECDHGTALCNQECINTIGSYSCDCYSGYKLLEDGFTCVGKDYAWCMC